jgi:hypothetical protein
MHGLRETQSLYGLAERSLVMVYHSSLPSERKCTASLLRSTAVKNDTSLRITRVSALALIFDALSSTVQVLDVRRIISDDVVGNFR